MHRSTSDGEAFSVTAMMWLPEPSPLRPLLPQRFLCTSTVWFRWPILVGSSASDDAYCATP